MILFVAKQTLRSLYNDIKVSNVDARTPLPLQTYLHSNRW